MLRPGESVSGGLGFSVAIDTPDFELRWHKSHPSTDPTNRQVLVSAAVVPKGERPAAEQVLEPVFIGYAISSAANEAVVFDQPAVELKVGQHLFLKCTSGIRLLAVVDESGDGSSTLRYVGYSEEDEAYEVVALDEGNTTVKMMKSMDLSVRSKPPVSVVC